ATYAGAYDSGGITVTVERTGGSAGAVSVDYATGEGTALAGTDYTATSGTLNWEEGVDGAQTVFVPLLNNPDSEGKHFSINLSGETGGATLGNPSSATIDITGPPPNIILFFMDDMGINDVGAYSYPEANPYPASGPAPISYSSSYDPLPQPNEANGLTPNIDSLASDGLRMTSFYAAAPVCTPSRAGMLTGCYPTRVDMEGVIWNSGHTWGLNPAEVTVAERLKQAGYTTGLVGKWHVGVFGGSYGMDFHPTHHGFDTFFGLPNSNDSWLTTLWDNGNEVSSYTTQGGLGGTLSSPVDTVGEQRYLLEALTEQAIGFIDAADSAGQPFFLYFASHAPHTPCWPHPDFDGVSGVSQYYDVVAELDHRIGQILDKLDALGIADNTLVIFTTDNGPWVTRYESSPSRRLDPENSVGSAYPFRGFKRGANEGGPRVPFLARLPGRIPAGLVVDGIGSNIDLLPTLLGLAGGERPAATIDGVDLWPLMNGSTATSPRTKFFYYEENDTSAVGVRKGDDKLIQSTDYDVRTGWFNLATDIQESTNLGSNTTLSALVSTHNSTMVRRTRATSTSNWIELDTDTVTVTEGGTATFSIRLHAPANVTVSVSRFSGDADLDVQSGASLSFTTGNYNVWQAVTLEAAADPDFVSSGATFRATASGLHLREIFALESDTTPPPLTPAESWRLFWFGQTENTGDAADEFDFEKDGLVNLLERAFGTDPTVGETALTRATGAPPVLSLVDAGGNPGSEYLALTYRRLAGGSGSTGAGYTAEGISYFVELDTDLSGPWSSGGFTVLSVQDDTPEAGIQTVTVRSNTALTAAAREFIRLRISSAP
ncbi:MAG: sulfatase-like hydrolase/transferase, partial [Oceanipulchritudo sp.]